MDTSYQLNPEEFDVFADRDFMPLKQKVWVKLEGILSILADRELRLLEEYQGLLDIDLSQPFPKTSRGENYKSYSYRVLDFPRLLEKEDIFLFRCMVLWGHPIGFHLILSGKYQRAYAEKLLSARKHLPFPAYYAAQESPWIWESDAEGLLALSSNSHIDHTLRDFCKLSSFIPLGDYRKIPDKGEDIFRTWLRLISS